MTAFIEAFNCTNVSFGRLNTGFDMFHEIRKSGNFAYLMTFCSVLLNLRTVNLTIQQAVVVYQLSVLVFQSFYFLIKLLDDFFSLLKLLSQINCFLNDGMLMSGFCGCGSYFKT